MASYLNLRISTALGERVKRHAAHLPNMTANAFAEESIAAICDLIESVGTRNVPRIVVLVDAAERAKAHPEALGPMGAGEVVRTDQRRRAASSPEPCPISEKHVQAIPEGPVHSTSRRSSSTHSLNEDEPHPREARRTRTAGPKARSTDGIKKLVRKETGSGH